MVSRFPTFLLVFLAALIAAFCPQVSAQTKIWDRGAALYSQTQTLQIELETLVWADDGPQKRQRIKSRIFYARPNQWRLQSEAPTKISLVADGKTLFVAATQERFSGTKYTERLGEELFGYDGGLSTTLSALIDNNLLFDEVGLEVVALGERFLDGSRLSGLRMRGDFQKGVAETTLWFAIDGSLKRAQTRAQIGKQFFNLQSRAISQKRDEPLPADTFQAPPPFKNDVFEPPAVELLNRAARFYGGVKNLHLRVRIRDLTPNGKYVRYASRSGIATLDFRRPNQLRLQWTPQKVEIATPSFRALVSDGKTVWQQDEYSAPDGWDSTKLNEWNRADFQKDLLGKTSFLGTGTGDVIWPLLQGRTPALQEDQRQRATAAFEVRFLSSHPRHANWQGVRIREWNQRIFPSIAEKVLWFETSNPQEPVLKQVQFRSDEQDDIHPMERSDETIESSDFAPIFPATRFQLAPGARVLNAN